METTNFKPKNIRISYIACFLFPFWYLLSMHRRRFAGVMVALVILLSITRPSPSAPGEGLNYGEIIFLIIFLTHTVLRVYATINVREYIILNHQTRSKEK